MITFNSDNYYTIQHLIRRYVFRLFNDKREFKKREQEKSCKERI